jgi:hypothetical protein
MSSTWLRHSSTCLKSNYRGGHSGAFALYFCLVSRKSTPSYVLSLPEVSELTINPYRATICSIFKTIELKTITYTQDPTWEGVNLGLWSAAELSIGILIASLPPLRKAFDRLFRKILPSTMTRSKTPNTHYGYGHTTNGNHVRLDTYERNRRTIKSTRPGEPSRDGDSDSERAILEDEGGKGAGIVKTTRVTVVGEAERLS